jgi:hypothetical protein
MGRYPEKSLQMSAIGWLARHRGYVEHFADPEGEGARMDTVGLLEDRLVTIEVKTDASALLALGPDRADRLECKIAATLGALYHGEATPLTRAATKIWDRRRPPIVAVLAKSWSANARERLRATCERRSRDWCFDWEFWRWTGERIETIAAGVTPTFDPAGAPVVWAETDIPRLRAFADRAAARPIDGLRALAADRGVADLFDRFLATATAMGYGLVPRRACMGATTRHVVIGKTRTLFAAYLDASSPGHLAVGCVAEWLEGDPADLPGSPSPHPFGFLNTDRFVSNYDEIDRLLRLPLRTSD